MRHTEVLDGAVGVEVAVGVAAVAVTTTVDDADANACPVVDPVARVAAGAGVGVPGAFSFCARFVALPKPRSLPTIPPPGDPASLHHFWWQWYRYFPYLCSHPYQICYRRERAAQKQGQEQLQARHSILPKAGAY